ncbi:putative bifunctional diguanylate cyclase/phosphodiesterase [Terriglobus aquaticus]|uniref:Bifunctional diguanylate cyclase/phosphodiesterase n=1 Tax=Terriglobus aquaticus TaxID=940139 RepID=A0ABW9KJA3_9BACT|nr:EAL domain-containing protein [Terriglobus aquaticus]
MKPLSHHLADVGDASRNGTLSSQHTADKIKMHIDTSSCTFTDDSMYRLLIQSVTDYAIYMLSLDGVVSNWNPGAERAKGYRSEEIVGRHFSVFYTEEDRKRGLPQHMIDCALRDGRVEGEGWRVRKDGTRLWAHVTLQSVHDSNGRTVGIAKITRDMTEKRERDRRALEQERNFRVLVQGVTDYAIYMLSPEGIVSNWNAGAQRAKGYLAEEIVGQHFSRFYRPEDQRRGLPQRALATALELGKFEGEGWRVRKDGTKFWAHVVIDAIRDESGALIGFAKITRDVTEKKRIEDQVSHLAHHDPLTTLLNRNSFRNVAERALNRGKHCALLYLDLDRFKPVNDSMGHLVGDKVLKIVAERILAELNGAGAAGRLGGDEFAILLTDVAGIAAANAVSERLIRRISQPIEIDERTVSVGVSIGIAQTDAEGCATEMLLRNADLALYSAKKEKPGSFRWYESGMESELVQRRELESDLRQALLRNEFALHYQPVVDTTSNRLTGYEALLRWNHPTRGSVSPADFIPFAEQHGLMIEIGDWVLRTACEEASRWADELTVSVNLSPTQFCWPNLVPRITGLLESSGLPANRLELEITETAMMNDVANAKSVLEDLRALGILVAMDDFGTGYSSLSFLRTLPFTRIKIDRSFVQDLGRTKESLAIVRAVTGLCSSLGVATTAEGVETEEQRRILKREGCQQLQGYLLGRPALLPPAKDAARVMPMELESSMQLELVH